jgi:hypothetical protein
MKCTHVVNTLLQLFLLSGYYTYIKSLSSGIKKIFCMWIVAKFWMETTDYTASNMPDITSLCFTAGCDSSTLQLILLQYWGLTSNYNLE